MRKFIILFIFVLPLENLVAQNICQSNVPAVVLYEIQLKFPNAEDISWKLVKGEYLAYFKVNNKSNKLTLNHKLEILRHGQDLYFSEIPKKVLDAIGLKVGYYDIEDADRFENEGKIRVSYRIANPGFRNETDDYGKWFIADNVVEGNSQVSKNNWDVGVQTNISFDKIKLEKAWSSLPINQQTAEGAYKLVLDHITPRTEITLGKMDIPC